VDAHTEERLILPIMIAKGKRSLFRFQPQKRCHFDLFNEYWGNGCLIVEHTVIPFLPNYPNRSKPDNFKKHMCGSRQSRHVSELDKVLMKVAWCCFLILIFHLLKASQNGYPTWFYKRINISLFYFFTHWRNLMLKSGLHLLWK